MHEHLTRELFRSIHKGWRNPGDLAAIAMAHLFELCPHCRSEFEAWRGELGEGVARDEGDYDGALQRIRERTAANDLGPDAEEARVERERRKAKSRAEKLLALPDDQRLDWIRKEKGSHSSLLLAEALIEECRDKTPGYPRDGCTLADLARVVLQHAPVSGYALELYALALARLANAIRVVGDLVRSDQILGDAKYFLRTQVGDRRIQAEIDSLEASLRGGQYSFRLANRVLVRPLTTYRLEGDAVGTALILAQLGRNHLRMGEYQRALNVLAEAEDTLSRGEVSAAYQLSTIRALRSSVLADLGEVEAAFYEIELANETGYRDPIFDLRTLWTVAKINLRRGDLDAAEEIYQRMVEEFTARDLKQDVASAQFDLIKVYLEKKRSGEALELIEQVHGAFREQKLHSRLAQVQDLRLRAQSM